MDFKEKSPKLRIIYLILALAFFLRLNGLGFGLPYLYNFDERITVTVSQNILATGDLNPHWFGFPGSFIMYILAFFYSIINAGLFLYKSAQGYLTGAGIALPAVTIYNTTLYYLIGRLLMTVFSLITICYTYIITKKLFNKQAGLLASFCLAIAPLYVNHSRLIRPDIPAAMLIMISLYFLLEYVNNGQKIDLLILSSLFAGFSIAAKYTSGVIMAPILFHCFFAPEQGQAGNRLRKALLYSFLGLFLFAPFVILDFKNALYYMTLEARPEHVGHERLAGIYNFAWYFKNTLTDGAGGLLFSSLAAFGLIVTALKKSYRKYLFISFPVIYFLVIAGFGRLRWSRWLIPVLPFEAALFGAGAYAAYNFCSGAVKREFFKKGILVLFAGLIIFGSLPAVVNDIKYGNRLNRTDTRTIAKEWINDNIPQGSVIAYEKDGPHLFVNPSKGLTLMNVGWAVVNRPVSFYKSEGVDYIVVTGDLKDIILADPGRYEPAVSRYKELSSSSDLIKTFNNKNNPGPAIEVYRLKK